MPPLSSIDGMGEKAAEAVAEASKDGTYLSLDDFRQRTKASKTVIDTMVELGILRHRTSCHCLIFRVPDSKKAGER